MANLDVIVLGLGGMGSSAVYHLAKKGVKVLGLEQFTEAHSLGSSHGKTRLIRKAYFEHPDYVPLLHRSYELWEELEKESAEKLFHQTGLTIFGRPESPILMGIKNSRDKFQLTLNELNLEQSQEWNSSFKVPNSFIGLQEPGAGFLEVEKCISAHLKVATQMGAQLRFEESCLSWGIEGEKVWVQTKTEKIMAKKLVITAGPWTSLLLKDLNLKLQVHRVTQFWFRKKDRSPVNHIKSCFAFDMPYGFVYGFPPYSGSRDLKIAIHKPGEKIRNLDKVDRKINPQDVAELIPFLSEVMPEIDPNPTEGSVCMYTMTPDEHFLIDRHPNFNQVFFAGGFSGHGFKFCPIVGRILSELVINNSSKDLTRFIKLRPEVISPQALTQN